MQVITTLGIAIALAMDAFAVALATGVSLGKVSFRQTFRLSWHFGLFQMLMPVLGWSIGAEIQRYVETYAHWIAFGLLAVVGSNMLWEANNKENGAEKKKKDSTKGLTLIFLSVATSIDALVVGLSMSMMNVSIILPALIIGLVAGTFTVLGLHLGKKIAGLAWLSSWAEILGGLVLWGIAVNVLRENGIL